VETGMPGAGEGAEPQALTKAWTIPIHGFIPEQWKYTHKNLYPSVCSNNISNS
jgi:hypothetical protein